jgi:hypothetical protein
VWCDCCVHGCSLDRVLRGEVEGHEGGHARAGPIAPGLGGQRQAFRGSAHALLAAAVDVVLLCMLASCFSLHMVIWSGELRETREKTSLAL